MAAITVTKTQIEGLVIVQPSVFGDERGYFMETYNKEEFEKQGLNMTFIQDNESKSKKGVLRGLHFQRKYSQGKLVRCTQGAVWDVGVDLRKGSPTYGEWAGVELSAENKTMFYIPEGFAHGFVVLSDEATFNYKCTNLYAPEYDGGIRWNDPEIGVEWPVEGLELLLSAKDQKQPFLKDIKDTLEF
ncbi:dTDP-4-dehydrorhamnose 3,5-epimerase [Eubacterium callanderi]|uniref:dTDP-4-dehydrorhamnose 3,5-epimerase n=1 Tax=Eubacterium callanderi TaxID=53442 RepID=UPI00391C5BFC